MRPSLAPHDDDGFEKFYRSSFPRLARTLTVLTADTRFVDDVVQDSFLLARRKWPEIRFYDVPEAWVTKVAMRLMRRRQSKESARSAGIVSDLAGLAAPGSICDIVAQHHDLYAAIRLLPDRQREIIVLYYLLGYPVLDIADILGIADGTVKAHLSHGRQRLGQLLAGESGPQIEGGMP
jgi:RNA polymerase sigma-70 factor (ECF subfamily)